MPKLTQAEIESALAELAGWAPSGDAIIRTFTLPSFPAALVFACAVDNLAERADHHPDILIHYFKGKALDYPTALPADPFTSLSATSSTTSLTCRPSSVSLAASVSMVRQNGQPTAMTEAPVARASK
jgi:hypothetical protein